MNDLKPRLLVKIKQSSGYAIDNAIACLPIKLGTFFWILNKKDQASVEYHLVQNQSTKHLEGLSSFMKWKQKNKPKISWSRLLFDMNSYMSNFSSPSKPQPNNLTRFLCWSWAISMTSFLNSSMPCQDFLDNLLTAISLPSGRTPCNVNSKVKHC